MFHTLELVGSIEGGPHNGALYVAVQYEGQVIPRVLIDPGSGVNNPDEFGGWHGQNTTSSKDYKSIWWLPTKHYWGNHPKHDIGPCYVSNSLSSDGHIHLIQSVARETMDPHGWCSPFHITPVPPIPIWTTRGVDMGWKRPRRTRCFGVDWKHRRRHGKLHTTTEPLDVFWVTCVGWNTKRIRVSAPYYKG